MKIPLNIGLKPVNSVTLYILTACFLLSYLFMIPFFYLDSWADEQVQQEVGIQKFGLNEYQLSFENQEVVKLSSANAHAKKIPFLEKNGILTTEQQDIVYEDYLRALEKFPTSLYLYLYENPFLIYCLVAGMVVCGLFDIAFVILILVMLYRAWKSLQPLSKLDFSKNGELISPGKSVGYLFIPIFNFFWFFKTFGGLEEKGRIFASKTESKYQGPSKLFGILFACICIGHSLPMMTFFDYMSLPWLIGMFAKVLYWIIAPIMAFELNAMIRVFAKATVEDDSPVDLE